MPFIPHTDQDIASMLKTIGVDSIEDLFDEIPAILKIDDLEVPDGEPEMVVNRIMRDFAAKDAGTLCFCGAGAYEHHIPAAIWQLTTRGEFYSAYTPYQAEASQGTLQVIYEYQTMMARLTGMDVSNASLYDGASALAESVLMAVRCHRKSKSKRVLVPKSVAPAYRRVLQSIVSTQHIVVEELDFDADSGRIDPSILDAYEGNDITAVVIPQPNFFGVLEQADELCDRAHALGAMVIGVVNPTSLALLNPPGSWGSSEGADIVCGDGQPLGVPMSSGGPYFGILCCRQSHVRQMPGRLVGRTSDLDGKEGFALTLQAREQHIRRAKATSNICTNQGLLVTAATIYMALMGTHGLEQVATACNVNTHKLRDRLLEIDGVTQRFSGPVFHEVVVSLPRPAGEVIEALAADRIVAGYDLARRYDDMTHELLVCATEMRSDEEIERFAVALERVLAA
jgi:glycine dehydrogenase subunit 1